MFTLTDFRIDSLLRSLRDLLRTPDAIAVIALFVYEMGSLSFYGYQYCHAGTPLDRVLAAVMTLFTAGFVIMTLIAGCLWNRCGQVACMFGRAFFAAYLWVWIMTLGFCGIFCGN